jgi:hypothetical protein
MATIPEKINPICSSSYLLDERFCLGNSLQFINFNAKNLSNNLAFLEKVGQGWNQIYSMFAANSTQWLQTVSNIKRFSPDWISVTNTVESLSANWTKEIILHYPTMILESNWNNNFPKTDTLNTWLNSTLPLSYTKGQKATIYVTLRENSPFTFSFDQSYRESCTPTGGGGSLNCIACPKPSRGCNWQGKCYNAMTKCTTVVNGGPIPLNCTGFGGRNLRIAVSRSGVDTHVVRTVELKLIRDFVAPLSNILQWKIISEQ